ncbi:MAG TPA: alpha/beta fold hydrolase [Acidimicrobiia bacterium]|nr:alpha/beta fold hydrolase [Acidimicrobiia bacterium]
MTRLFSFKYHSFDVPLDWENTDSNETISITLREILDVEGKDKPPILFLQGGPGFGSPLPTDDKWMIELQKRFRIFLLDSRGMGMSTPIDIPGLLEMDQNNRIKTVEYLTHFRADSIARDVEHIRLSLFNDEDFYTFGQSFGGWCTLSYLSLFPNSPKACFLNGGYPPIGHEPLNVYRALVPQVDRSNQAFLDRYPETKEQLEYLVHHLDDKTLFSLAQSGFWSGFSNHHKNLRVAIEGLYYDLLTIGRPSLRSRRMMYDPMGFASNPIYVFLHEAIYCEGTASNWAAETVMLKENGRPSLIDISKFFLGENVLHNHFETIKELTPLTELMETLMSYSDWGQLYDTKSLARCEAPVIGLVMEMDTAVVTSYSRECASLLGNGHVIKSDLDHHAFYVEPKRVFTEMFAKLDEVTQ